MAAVASRRTLRTKSSEGRVGRVSHRGASPRRSLHVDCRCPPRPPSPRGTPRGAGNGNIGHMCRARRTASAGHLSTTALSPVTTYISDFFISVTSGCVKHLSNGSLTTVLNTNRPAVCEIWKTGVHVRTCRCTPPQTCGKHLSNGFLVTHQI